MKCREFIAALGGAATMWPLAAPAQERARRVGVLMNLPTDEPEAQLYVAAFQQGMQGAGLERRPQPADRLSLGAERSRAKSPNDE